MIYDLENSLSTKSDFSTFWQGCKARQGIRGGSKFLFDMESQREYDAKNLFQIFKFYTTTFFGHDLTSLGLFTNVFLF